MIITLLKKKGVFAFLIPAAVIAVPAVFPSAARALMPPHVTGTVPEDGGILKGATVIIKGYSLQHAPEEPVVTDLTTGEKVPLVTTVTCKERGDPDGPPGSLQFYCTQKVTLFDVIPDHRYELKYLETTVRFTTAAAEPVEESQ